MPFKLIMKRKVFVKVQILCDEYEEKFKEKIATAKVVNVLLAEALIHRGLIPSEFIQEQYGSPDPISKGFTAKARNDKTRLEVQCEKVELSKIDKQLKGMLEQWNFPRENIEEWRKKAFVFAEKYADKLQSARDILALKEAI